MPNNRRGIIAAIYLLISACGIAGHAQAQTGGTVLLTFDVEFEGDAEGLERLNIDVPASYFFTGEYARSHPDLLRQLSAQGQTIGSHTHFHDDLATLNPHHLALDLEFARLSIEAVTCQRVAWFRAPFLSYNDAVMQQVVDAGYLLDSSDKELWPTNALLPEMAISVHQDRLVSDIDTIGDGTADAPGLPFLKDAFDAHRNTDRPLVILLHPRIIETRADILHGFIAYAKDTGAEFITADTLRDRAYAGVARRAMVLSDGKTLADDDAVARVLITNKITDVIVPFGTSSGLQPDRPVFTLGPELTELREDGLRFHVALRPMMPPLAMPPGHDAMLPVTSLGDAVLQSNLDALRWNAIFVARLASDPAIDGIFLTGLGYAGLTDGLTDLALTAFENDTGLGGLTTENVLSQEYNAWIRWRSDRLASFVAQLRAQALDLDPDALSFGAFLPPGAFLDFRVADDTGVDPAKLAPQLDSILLTLSPGEISGLDNRIKRLRLAASVLAGDIDILIGLETIEQSAPHISGTFLSGDMQNETSIAEAANSSDANSDLHAYISDACLKRATP